MFSLRRRRKKKKKNQNPNWCQLYCANSIRVLLFIGQTVQYKMGFGDIFPGDKHFPYPSNLFLTPRHQEDPISFKKMYEMF